MWEAGPQSYSAMMLVFLTPLVGVEGEKKEGQELSGVSGMSVSRHEILGDSWDLSRFHERSAYSGGEHRWFFP